MAPLEMVHRTQLPQLATGQLAPAVVMIYGWQGDENVMAIFERTLPPGVAIISPRAPLDMNNGGFGWYKPVDDEPLSLPASLPCVILSPACRPVIQSTPIASSWWASARARQE